jgi:hypothetical protein
MRSRSRFPRRHVRCLSPSVFSLWSRDRSYRHLVVLLPSGETQCGCEAQVYEKICWARRQVARYLLRHPRRITEAVA